MTVNPALDEAIKILRQLMLEAIANQSNDPDKSEANQAQWKGYIQGIKYSIYRLEPKNR